MNVGPRVAFVRRWPSAFSLRAGRSLRAALFGISAAAERCCASFPRSKAAAAEPFARKSRGVFKAWLLSCCCHAGSPRKFYFLSNPEPFCCCEFARKSHDVTPPVHGKMCGAQKLFGDATNAMLQEPASCC
jgi:hypothetical protein